MSRNATHADEILTIAYQEELMFEDISKPLKGKRKEKDVGKRHAYVRVVTSLGGASLNIELYCEKVGIVIYPVGFGFDLP